MLRRTLPCLLSTTALLACALGASARAAPLRITYDSQQGPEGLWAMAPDGSHRASLLAGAFAATWSRDGGRVAFETHVTRTSIGQPLPGCEVGSASDIEVARADGGGRRRLVRACGDARISPDGRRVAYSASTDTLGVVDVTDAHSAHTITLTCAPEQQLGCDSPEQPTWAGNGAILYHDGDGSALWEVSAGGGQVRQVASGGGAVTWGGGEAVSPDGRTIAAAGTDDFGNAALYLVSAGGSPRALAVAPGNHAYVLPEWSPDGKTIVFQDSGPDGTAVDTIAASGGKPVRRSGADSTAAFPSFGAPGRSFSRGAAGRRSRTGHGFAVAKVSLVPRSGGARLTVDVPAPGTLTIALRTRGSGARTLRRAVRAGSVQASVSVSRGAFGNRRSLPVTIVVSFRPRRGRTMTRTLHVTLERRG